MVIGKIIAIFDNSRMSITNCNLKFDIEDSERVADILWREQYGKINNEMNSNDLGEFIRKIIRY